MATRRRDPLDEYLEQNSLESMGFVDEPLEKRFERPKPPKTEPCPVCGFPSAGGTQTTCGKQECVYKYVTQRLRKSRTPAVETERILPRVDDIVCEGEVIPEPRKRK